MTRSRVGLVSGLVTRWSTDVLILESLPSPALSDENVGDQSLMEIILLVRKLIFSSQFCYSDNKNYEEICHIKDGGTDVLYIFGTYLQCRTAVYQNI